MLVKDSDNNNVLMSERGPGDILASLLSIMDILCGLESRYKTLSAQATMATTIVRIPVRFL